MRDHCINSLGDLANIKGCNFHAVSAIAINMTLPEGYIEGFHCTLSTCNVKLWGFIHYQPSLVGNILFLVLLDILALAQLVLGIKYKTGLVCVSMLLGLACESLGYVARILLHYDPFNRAYFLWYLITLTLGPVFIAAAIYLCLGRIVTVYGEGMSRIRARSYTVIFMVLRCRCGTRIWYFSLRSFDESD